MSTSAISELLQNVAPGPLFHHTPSHIAMQDHNPIQHMCEIRIITNGYIVSFGSKDVFCRDAEDIGKAVVSLFTANKLAPKQLDLFDNEQEKNSNGK